MWDRHCMHLEVLRVKNIGTSIVIPGLNENQVVRYHNKNGTIIIPFLNSLG